jgi:hypothetical protein
MPYCRFNHGKMLQTRGKFSKRDGGLRQYYHCRCDGCSYTQLEPRTDYKFNKENETTISKSEGKKVTTVGSRPSYNQRVENG